MLSSMMTPEYMGKDAFFGGTPPLPESAGYAIVLGFGAFFSVFTTALVYIDKYVNGTEHTSEYFNTAGRNVKTGLTASVIVSQWTWAATLLQSSHVAWNYGVSGPFWYASGATIQVLLFGILAIELKRRARTCHTVCELVYVRWGKAAHLTFIFFCLVANVIVTSMLLLGGAATVYVKEYSSDLIYENLQAISDFTVSDCEARFSTDGTSSTTFYEAGTYSCGPVADNNDGSYVTMLSLGGLKFGIINIVGNFGTVFVDQSYWQSAIAAKPASAQKNQQNLQWR